MKLGKFYVSKNLVEDENFSDVLAKLKFIPIRVEYLMHKPAFEYIGTSPYFKEVEHGFQMPEYSIYIITVDGNITDVTVKEEGEIR